MLWIISKLIVCICNHSDKTTLLTEHLNVMELNSLMLTFNILLSLFWIVLYLLFTEPRVSQYEYINITRTTKINSLAPFHSHFILSQQRWQPSHWSSLLFTLDDLSFTSDYSSRNWWCKHLKTYICTIWSIECS